jgi:nucleoid-associated protein YgaU
MAYKVKSGDTLSQIAKNMGTTLKALMAANPQIKNANKIKPGQSIKTPTKTTTKTTPGTTTISVFGKDVQVKKVGGKHYRVKKDGTLAKNPVSKLQQANIDNPNSKIVKRTGGKTTTTTASALPKSRNPYAGMSKSEMAAIAMKKKKPTALANKKKAAKKTQNLVASAIRSSKKNKG